jgi:HK97 family phage major capsid protein
MDEKEIALLAETVQKTVKEELPGVVTNTMKEVKEGIVKDVESMKETLKDLTAAMAAKGGAEGDEEKTLAQKTYAVAVMRACAKGMEFNEAKTQAKAAFMNGNVATNEGAELVFDQFLEDIVMVISSYRVIEDITLYNIIKGDNLKIPKVVTGLTTAWVAEGASTSKTKPTTSTITITTKIAQTLVDVSESLMEDSLSIPDLYNLLVTLIGESQAGFIESQIFNGSGSGSNIEGICVNSSVAKVVLSGTSFTTVTRAKLVETWGSVGTKYLVGAGGKWYMSRGARTQLMTMETDIGTQVFPEMEKKDPTLFGDPVIETDKLDNAGGASKVFAVYGNFKHFIGVRRKDIEVKKGYSGTGFADGLITVKGEQRIHGQIAFTEAFAVLVTAAS